MQQCHSELLRTATIIILCFGFTVFRNTSGQPIQFLGQPPFTAYVSRATPPGNIVYTFVAINITDGRPDGMSYSIIESNHDQTLFEINSHTGHLVITQYLPLHSWELKVQAERGLETVTANLRVIVLPEYNISPVFEHSEFSFSLSEYTPVNSPFAVAHAFSLDPSSSEHSYSIFSGNFGNNLAINSTTGVLTVVRELDHETTAAYDLTVQYSDIGAEVSVRVEILVLDENDNRPEFSEVFYEVTVSESVSLGALVLCVSASDGDSAENGIVEFSIIEGGISFVIDHLSGELYTAQPLDYEQESLYSLRVVASDRGMPSLTSTTIVTVNVLNEDDVCPVFESMHYSVIFAPGTLILDGMEVVTVHAMDPDVISNVTYTLATIDQAGALKIDMHTGAVRLVSASPNTYNLRISASDANCTTPALTEIVINTGSINNHTPEFVGPCEDQIMENSVGGTVVTTLGATDNDDGVYGELTYAFSDESLLFTLDSVTGEVTLSNDVVLDREEKPFHVLGVTVTDGGSRQAYCLLNITVLDEDDNDPTFLISPYEVGIPQNPAPGTYVVQVLAEDADDGSNRLIQYELSDSVNGAFMIDSESGIIQTVTELSQQEYTLTVQAFNNLMMPSSSVSVIIHLDSDIQLVFNQSLYSTTICENLPYSTSVLQISPNVGTSNAIIYNLISGSEYYTNGDGVFGIDTDGYITVTSQGNIDFEKLPDSRFLFSVRGESQQGATLSISTVEINVLDSDDNGPTFQARSVRVNISENSPVGTLVTQLAATDPDSGSNRDITYTLNFGEENFEILDSGKLRTLVMFDAEVSTETSTRISAINPNPINTSDPCSTARQSGTVLVRVNILDINDNPPTFTEPPSDLAIPENTSLGTIIYTFVATDPDVSDSDRLGYTITDGNTDHNFIIDNNGSLVLVQSLNHEEKSILTIIVQVSDGTYTDTTLLTILVTNVDDEPPHFLHSMYASDVIENSPLATSVLQVSATDADTASINYWLTAPAEDRFSISSSGILTVTGTIDREEFEDGVISFLVVAQGGVTATTLVTITVIDENDCVPLFTNVDVATVQENVTPESNGVHVATVLAVDSDTGRNGEVSYTLLTGEENGFTINSETGRITAHAMYDREAAPFYTILVEAMDMGADVQLSSTASLQVKIGDENDNTPFFPFPYAFTRIFEGLDIDTEVIHMPAIDLDEGTNAALTYTLLSSDPIQSIFTVDSSTGIVTLVGTLNYEVPLHRFFTLTFSIADPIFAGEYNATLEIHLLDRNDNIPVFVDMSAPLGLMIAETIPVGTAVLEVVASDDDSGVNAQIMFSIVSGDPNRDFVISAINNNATIISTAKQLDYETKSSYDLVIEACDQGTPSECAIMLVITLSISNVNDVAPSFSQTLYEGSVLENAAPVNSILQVEATDPDFGSSFEYQIESGNSGGKFNLNSTTGILSSLVSLNREEQETYILVITAADAGSTPVSGTSTVVITVLDIDDNPPAEESQWQIHMLLLDGQLQTEQLINIYFNDPDTIYTFSDCYGAETENAPNFSTIPSGTCHLRLEQGSPPEGFYGLRAIEVNQNVSSRVDIEVKHIFLSDIPTEYLVTISLAMSTAYYLDNVYTSFPATLATILGVESNQLTVVSVQDGYHDPPNIVDVSFTVKNREKSYLNPTFILQNLYTKRDALQLFGYQLSALPTDPCSSEPCISQASCKSQTTVTNSSLTAQSPSFILISPTVQFVYECECVPGTSGQDCSINFDDCYSNPCRYGARCIDEVNGFQCDCPMGTSGTDCSIAPDACSSNPCQNGAICHNTPGSYSCLCLPGYYGPVCQYHYFKTAPMCDSSPCQNGGTCSPGRDSFTCLCINGYSGQHCEQEAALQGGCTGNPCYNGSTCTESPSGPICSCSVGFTGPFCRWSIDNCELHPCRNGGTCATGLYGSYQCYCPPPYTGQTCEDFILGCDSSPCLNGGMCLDTSGGEYTCECTRGYSGDNCEYPVQPQNLCSSNPCLTGECTYGFDSYTCSCPTNSSGEHCESASPPSTSCGSNPCQHGGKCVEESSDYSCSCSPGFTGTNCETNINDCDHNPCNDGTCQDGINGYLCECPSTQITGYNCEVVCPNGLTGDFCETASVQCPVDESPCQNGGTCLDDLGSYSCVCPPTHTGPTCEQENTCDAVQCFNGGTCSALEDGGYGCTCSDGFDGTNCQLLSISFSRLSSPNSYRAYPPLHPKGQTLIQFEFSTLDSDGLLLYNTQLQAGISSDYIAVEVVGGQLVVGMSHGEDAANVVLTSSVAVVNDGQWHSVTIMISGKRVSVTLDFCHDLDDVIGATAGCYSTAATLGHSSFLDLGLPLWLGGAPSSASSHVSSGGITACMRQVYINGALLDLNSHLDQRNSQPGCPQLDGQCVSDECGIGDCVATWSTTLCACPPLLSGHLCDTVSPSLTYTGNGYAHYTLTEEGARQRRQAEGKLRSTYWDLVSLNLRTVHADGVLFSMQDKSGSEYLHVELESGQVMLHLNLGSEQETVLVVSEQRVNDSEHHNVTISRTGQLLNITVDSSTLQYSLPLGTPLTLETHSSEIYTGGSPHTHSWFVGCLQDVRINQFSLPILDSNDFASVVYEGSEDGHMGVTEGCNLSPCYLNPCGSGSCEEVNSSSYQCVCSNGERMTAACPQSEEEFQYMHYIIGAVVLGVLLIVFTVTVPAGLCFQRLRSRKRMYLIETAEKFDSQELAELFAPSQAIIISNEQGGGEEDTATVDWSPLNVKDKSTTEPSPASTRTTSSKVSQVSNASQASSESRSRTKKYRFQLPISEKGDIDAEGEGEEEGEGNVRSNSPVIQAYLEDRVTAANDDIMSVDSLHKFCEEGSEDSEVDSLSSDLNSEDEEEYTLERLRAAGPPLSSLAPLLVHVLQNGDNSVRDNSAASDILLSSHSPQ